jgi:PAS domain S-box-containing protein
MTSDTEPQPVFADELRLFVRLRWLAGATVILGAGAWAPTQHWTGRHMLVLCVGIGIIAYNAVLWMIFRRGASWRVRSLVAFSWAQIVLDMVCLTPIVLATGGMRSPLLGLFVLHMVFAGLLLPRLHSHLAAVIAMAMMLGGMSLAGQWFESAETALVFAGWVVTLLLTAFLSSHAAQVISTRQRELRRQHRRMHAILETAADGIVTVDDEGLIETANSAAEAMFGYEPETLVGVPIAEIIPGEAWNKTTGRLHHHDPNGGEDPIEHPVMLTAKRRDGTELPVGFTVSGWMTAGRYYTTGVFRDATERIQTEAALKTLNQRLKDQQQAMIQHEKMVAVGQMAAGVAHEISNPLANMGSLLELIRRHPENMDAKAVENLSEQVTRISRIVRQLTHYCHPGEAERQIMRMDEVVDTALAMVRFDRRHRTIYVEDHVQRPGCDLMVQPYAVQQVLVNIFQNAFDAVEDVSDPRVTILTECHDDGLCGISVHDNGCGIAPDDLERVFEPFYTTKPVGRGTGLGLAIVRQLVEEHGGKCAVTSEPGQGTTVRVCLPSVTDQS